MSRLQGISRRRQMIWWAFVAVVTGAGVLISAAAVGIADWLDSRIGFAGVLVGSALVFAILLWMASRLDD